MKVKLTLSVPEEIVKQAKKKAIDEEVDVSAVVAGFLSLWIDGAVVTPKTAKRGVKD